MSDKQSEQSKKPFVTQFASEKLIGYQCDDMGKFKTKVFRAEACMSDGSIWILYATKSAEGFDDPNWDPQPNQQQPIIHRDNFGIWVVDPKTVMKKRDII